MIWSTGRSLLIALFLLFAVQVPAQAITEFEINNETGSVRDVVLTANAIQVKVNFEPIKLGTTDTPRENNLKYQIFYKEQPFVSAATTTYYTGKVSLQDLDADGTDEVLVQTFSGGAHCCTNITIYSWRNNQFQKTETGMQDGYGGSFQDLNGDKKLEFVSVDQSFLYRFSSYAGSFPPSAIYEFREGKLINATRQYPQYLKSTVWKMYQAFLEVKKQKYEVNGVLAGYVAQKALLGEFAEGWKLMMAHYDRSSDWGLEIYNQDGKEVGRYPDFPAALRAHLIKNGYIRK